MSGILMRGVRSSASLDSCSAVRSQLALSCSLSDYRLESRTRGVYRDGVHRKKSEATQLYQDDPQPYMVLGELYEANGQNHEAEEKCRQALLHNDTGRRSRAIYIFFGLPPSTG